MIAFTEKGTVFPSEGMRLVGIASVPEAHQSTGVLVLVGGPQYRVGSHRQFTLLARQLAAAGIPCFRFDYAGMGDSEGERKEFYQVQSDITAALDRFQEMVPGISKIVVWGLCDAASLAMIHAYKEDRVSSMILLNPWVHYGDYSPEVKLSHYYAPMLKGRETWQRIFSGKVDVLSAVKEFFGDGRILVKKTLGMSPEVPARHPLVADMLDGLGRFKGDVLFLLSEKDLTAREFISLTSDERPWKRLLSAPNITVQHVPDADHTFSKKDRHEEMIRLTLDWAARVK